MTFDTLRKQLVEIAGLLIDRMKNASADEALIFLAQSRACIAISKDDEKLENLWRILSEADSELLDPADLNGRFPN